MALSATQTVRQLATEIPNATRIFEKLGIDYCCGGGKSLEAACVQARIPVTDVLRTLEEGSASVHGRNHTELVAIQKVFAALGAELTSHMMKEEMVLFPYIAQMEKAHESGK